MDAERDTDGTTDAYEGDHTPADGAGTDGEDGKPDTGPGNRLPIIRRNPAPVRVYPRRDTTAIVGLYNWFGQTYILGRLSLVHISLFLPRPAYNPNDNPFGYGFPS